MKRLSLIFCMLSTLLVVSCVKDEVASTGDISGVVKEISTSETLQGCQITLSPLGRTTTTGTDGRYEFKGLSPQTYSLEFSKEGYNPERKNVVVIAGEKATADAMMTKINKTKTLSLSEESFDFGDLESSKELYISIEDGSVSISVKSNASWLIVNPESGVVTKSGLRINLLINREGLSVNDYSSSITITSPFGNINIPVVMKVTNSSKPEVKITGDFYDVTEKSFGIKGLILKTGGSQITSHGHCWSTNENPSVDDNKTNLGTRTEVGEYSSIIDKNIEAGKTYFVRAYAENKYGVGYSEVVRITINKIEKPTVETLAATDIENTTATINGKIVNSGGGTIGTISECGFYYGKDKANLSKHKMSDVKNSFMLTLTELEQGVQYYFSAYAVNSKGESRGDTLSFKTKKIGFPTVIAKEAKDIKDNTATISGEIQDNGGSDIEECGFYYGTSQNPTTKHKMDKISNTFTLNLTNLKEGVTYYYKAYAINKTGEGTSDVLSFTTNKIDLPSVRTNAATEIEYHNAVLHGIITNNGNGAISERGFYFGIDAPDQKQKVSSESNEFSLQVQNLKQNQTYYFKAYAINEKGEATGEIQSFKTQKEPVVNAPWDGTVATEFSSGSGTIVDPYIIETPQQLAFMENSNKKAYYKLMNDIDLNNIAWNPISSFEGVFDGNRHTISNLRVARIQNNAGLFGSVGSNNSITKIKDVTIRNVNINLGEQKYIGSLVGSCSYSTTINNCHVILSLESKINGASCVGGLIGGFHGRTVEISDCSVTLPSSNYVLYANSDVGGLVGYFGSEDYNNKFYFENCHVSGVVSGESGVGGLLGTYKEYGPNCEITNSSFNGTLVGNKYVGGILGQMDYSSFDNSKTLSITSCAVSIDINANSDAGGIIGFRNYSGAIYIISSYAICSFSSFGNNFGGIVGSCRDLNSKTNIYCSYSILKSSNIPGFIGYTQPKTLSDCATTSADLKNNRGDNVLYNCKGSDIINHFRDSYSDYLSNWNLSNTFTETISDGSSIICPRLKWESNTSASRRRVRR